MDRFLYIEFMLINVSKFLPIGTLCLNKHLHSIVKNYGSVSLNLLCTSSDGTIDKNLADLHICKLEFMLYKYKKMDSVQITGLIHDERKPDRPVNIPNINTTRLKLTYCQIDNLNNLDTLKHLELNTHYFYTTLRDMPNLESLIVSGESLVPNIHNLLKLKKLTLESSCNVHPLTTITNLPSLLDLKIGNTGYDPDMRKEQVIIANINTDINYLHIGLNDNLLCMSNIRNLFDKRPTNLKGFSVIGDNIDPFLMEEIESRKHKEEEFEGGIFKFESI